MPNPKYPRPDGPPIAHHKAFTRAIPTVMPNPQDLIAMRQEWLRQVVVRSNDWIQDGVFNTADATKIELDRISTIIADKAKCVLITADTKSVESATRKINDECDGHWLDLKDVARVTMAAESLADLTTVVKVLTDTLVARDGFTLVKTAIIKADDDECGYSGYNYVVRFGPKPESVDKPDAPNASSPLAHQVGAASARTIAALNKHAQQPAMRPIGMSGAQIISSLRSKPAPVLPGYVGRMGEIQANTFAMMYGKMSKETFGKLFGPAKWQECFQQTGIEGGIGHLFYEDWRVDKKSARGLAIAELSKRYYRRMRGTEPRPSEGADQLREDVASFVASRPKDGKH